VEWAAGLAANVLKLKFFADIPGCTGGQYVFAIPPPIC
jgi:hypothetical protein